MTSGILDASYRPTQRGHSPLSPLSWVLWALTDLVSITEHCGKGNGSAELPVVAPVGNPGAVLGEGDVQDGQVHLSCSTEVCRAR